MPDRRELLKRRFFERIKEEQRKWGPGVKVAWHVTAPPAFIDYWIDVPATYPEKLVFAELIRRRVNFYFGKYIGDLAITPDVRERIRPDFYLPDYNIIIEVYGVYWHSRETSFEDDAYRAMLLIASGYKYYILNDYAILKSVRDAVDNIPELRNPLIHGTFYSVANRPFDPNASVKARMTKYPKVGGVKWKAEKQKARVTKWQSAGAPVAKPIPPLYPVMYETFPELIALGVQWGTAYEQWLKQYGDWADEYNAWRDAYYEFFGYWPED